MDVIKINIMIEWLKWMNDLNEWKNDMRVGKWNRINNGTD